MTDHNHNQQPGITSMAEEEMSPLELALAEAAQLQERIRELERQADPNADGSANYIYERCADIGAKYGLTFKKDFVQSEDGVFRLTGGKKKWTVTLSLDLVQANTRVEALQLAEEMDEVLSELLTRAQHRGGGHLTIPAAAIDEPITILTRNHG